MSSKDYVVLRPAGRLDAAGARVFETEWKDQIASGNAYLLFDLTDVTYISSSGLRTLLAAVRNAERVRGSVKICCLGSRMREIFEMAGFDHVFEVYSSRQEAEAAF